MKTLFTSLTILSILVCGSAMAESRGSIEISRVLREHSYDLDITADGTRYHIDEQVRSGWAAEAGWSITPRWTILAGYSKHDTNNADGIILTLLSRIQAPILYKYQRASLGLQNHLRLTENLWLDTTVSYQRTAQGIGNFFISSGNFSFGLDSVSRDSGVAAEIALRTEIGRWQFELQAGHDPHAGFKLAATDVDVESSFYGGAGVSFSPAEHWTIGVDYQTGKVSDLALSLGYKF